jgi:hypothetical protein
LGTNIYLCGICTDEEFRNPVGMRVANAGRQPHYRCGQLGHLRRSRKHVDGLVIETVLRRLSRPDAVDLLPSGGSGVDVDVKSLRTEAKAIRDGLNELAADKALGLIDRA